MKYQYRKNCSAIRVNRCMYCNRYRLVAQFVPGQVHHELRELGDVKSKSINKTDFPMFANLICRKCTRN